MKVSILAILALILASLACGQYITPTPTATLAPDPTSHPVRPLATQTTVVPTETQVVTAKVAAPVVNVRKSPDGEVVGQIYAGQDVVILSCDESWCKIKEPAGYVFKGCLTVDSDLGCTAK